MSVSRTLRSIHAALVAGFIALASGVVRAQAVSVTGRATDSQGGVVVNASVTLSGGPGVRPMVVRSTADGTFRFDSIPFGRYTLQIDSPGFKPWIREVVVGANDAAIPATLDIAGVIEDVQVSGRAPVTLATPVPTASRLGLPPLETPATVAAVSGALIRDLGTPTLMEGLLMYWNRSLVKKSEARASQGVGAGAVAPSG
jgi:hypothetical protein